MANNKIQHYRTTVPGRKPDASKMLEGQLALNITDKRAYTKLGTGIVNIGFGAGATVEGGNTWTGTVNAARLEADTLKITSNTALATVTVNGKATMGGVEAAWIDVNNNLTVKGLANITGDISAKAANFNGNLKAVDITGGTIKAAGWLITDNNRLQINNDSTKHFEFNMAGGAKQNGLIFSEQNPTLGLRLGFRVNGDSGTDAYLLANGQFSARHLRSRETMVLENNGVSITKLGGSFDGKWWRVPGLHLTFNRDIGQPGQYGAINYVEAPGQFNGFEFNTNGDGAVYIQNGGRIEASSDIKSNGILRSGDAQFDRNGNCWGVAWGGWLSDWLRNQGVSDKRVKTNIKATKRVAINSIKKMKFYDFDWTEDARPYKNTDTVRSGWISQELEEIDPSFVAHLFDGKTVNPDQSALLPLAFKAIQELTAKVESLEKQLKK